MKCEKCGHELPYGARICPNCGVDIVEKNQYTTQVYNHSKVFHEEDYRVTKSNPFTIASVIVSVFAMLFMIVGRYQMVFFILSLIIVVVAIVLYVIGQKRPGKNNAVGVFICIATLILGAFIWYQICESRLPFIIGTWKSSGNDIYEFDRDGNYEVVNAMKREYYKGTYKMEYDKKKKQYVVTMKSKEAKINGMPMFEKNTNIARVSYNEEKKSAEVVVDGKREKWKKQQ